MFDGYTEPIHNTEARAWRIALASVGYPPKFCTEADADLVNGCIMIAEADDDPRTGEQSDIDRWQNEPDFEDEPKEVQTKVDFTKIKPIHF